MIDYNTLSIGLLCSDSESYNFCYEAVKDDFFDEIGGYMMESNDRIQKIRDKEKAAKAEAKKKAAAAKAKLAKLKKLDRKQKAAIAAALVALGAVVVALKKTAPERAEKLREKLNKLEREANEAMASIGDGGPLRDGTGITRKQTKDFLTYENKVKKQIKIGRKLTILCKIWNVPFPGGGLFNPGIIGNEDFDEDFLDDDYE